MSRVAIIDNGGGGKSTLAIKLGKALGIDLWMVHRQMRPRLLDLIDRYRAGREVVMLTSPQSLRQFTHTHCGSWGNKKSIV